MTNTMNTYLIPSLVEKGVVSNWIMFVAFLEADEIQQRILSNFLQGIAQVRETILRRTREDSVFQNKRNFTQGEFASYAMIWLKLKSI